MTRLRRDPRPSGWRRPPTIGIVALTATLLLAGIVGCSDDEPDAMSTSEFCSGLADQQGLVETIGNLETTRLEGRQQQLDDLAERAPEDIRTEMQRLAEAVGEVLDALDTVESGDVQAAEEALRPLQEDLSAAQEAGAAVETYATETCGFDLRTGDTVATTVPAAAPGTGDDAGTTTAPPTTVR